MSLTVVKGLQSEIFVPVTPPPVWAPVKKELKDMTIALATAAGVHHKDQKRFNLAGDFTWRKITDKMPSDELMVSHGGYDNSDVTKTSTVCSRLTVSMSLLKKDLSKHVHRYMPDSWVVAETRKNSNMKLVLPLQRCL